MPARVGHELRDELGAVCVVARAAVPAAAVALRRVPTVAGSTARMTGEQLLTIAGAVARSWTTRYGLDYDELRAEIVADLVAAEPDGARHAFEVADWTAERWCYAERTYRAQQAV